LTADVALVSCAKTKAKAPVPAAALYVSPLFRKSLQAALDHARRVLILSAEHGIVELSTILAPYDTTLKHMPAVQRRVWGEHVGASLETYIPRRSQIEVFCGDEYLNPLAPAITHLAYTITNRLVGMSLGQRLRHLALINDESELKRLHGRFRKAIYRLWVAQRGGRLLSETSGRQIWPGRGVYFLLDPDVPAANGRMPRIIRVGTHAVSAGSRTTLWDRISTHRGTTSGGGSHRSSIFRLHVGRALAARDPSLLQRGGQTWGQGQSAPADIRAGEQHIEEAVSATIGAMRLLWVNMPDAASPTSERAYVERNAIALLSRIGLLSAYGSREWLGRHSPEWKIAASGLWNLNHVFSRFDPAFLDVFERCVDHTIEPEIRRRASKPTLAPMVSSVTPPQFALFSQDPQSRVASAESDQPPEALSETNRSP
jgi:hypothetical protein